jgi:hypothetical protein
MNICQDIRPVTYLKSRAADLLNYINKTHRPVIIAQNGIRGYCNIVNYSFLAGNSYTEYQS